MTVLKTWSQDLLPQHGGLKCRPKKHPEDLEGSCVKFESLRICSPFVVDLYMFSLCRLSQLVCWVSSHLNSHQVVRWRITTCCKFKWEDSFQCVAISGDDWWCIRFEWDRNMTSVSFRLMVKPNYWHTSPKRSMMTWRPSFMWATRAQSSENRSPTNSRKSLALQWDLRVSHRFGSECYGGPQLSRQKQNAHGKSKRSRQK